MRPSVVEGQSPPLFDLNVTQGPCAIESCLQSSASRNKGPATSGSSLIPMWSLSNVSDIMGPESREALGEIAVGDLVMVRLQMCRGGVPTRGALLRRANSDELKAFESICASNTSRVDRYGCDDQGTSDDSDGDVGEMKNNRRIGGDTTQHDIENDVKEEDVAPGLLPKTTFGFIMTGQYSHIKGFGIGLAVCNARKLQKLFGSSKAKLDRMIAVVCNTEVHKGQLVVLSIVGGGYCTI